MKNEITVTYSVEITEVFKNTEAGVDEKFLKNDYPEIIREKIKNKMDFDDVSKPRDYKIFVRETKKE